LLPFSRVSGSQEEGEEGGRQKDGGVGGRGRRESEEEEGRGEGEAYPTRLGVLLVVSMTGYIRPGMMNEIIIDGSSLFLLWMREEEGRRERETKNRERMGEEEAKNRERMGKRERTKNRKEGRRRGTKKQKGGEETYEI
jgi:hypothetical protein